MPISLNKIGTSLQTVLENPFGVQFVVHDQLPGLTLASGINMLGYVDGLEHIVGISRSILGVAMLRQSKNMKESAIAAAHIARGGMEAFGNWEMTMLVCDGVFAVGYIIVCVAKSEGSSMSISLRKTAASLHTLLKNPFGLQIAVYDQLPGLTLASGINMLGYVDGLEHIVGISRGILGLAMLRQSTNFKESVIAAAHIVRAGMEFSGNWEITMLFFDSAFTVGYIIASVVNSGTKDSQQQLTAQ